MQAEGDSLTGLSEVPASQTPSLVPNTAGWYSEPNQAMELRPQDPALTQLRHKLGLPLQQPVHQPAAVQQTDHGNAGQQGTEDFDGRACQSEVERLTSCSYEVRYMDGAMCYTQLHTMPDPTKPQTICHVIYRVDCFFTHSLELLVWIRV